MLVSLVPGRVWKTGHKTTAWARDYCLGTRLLHGHETTTSTTTSLASSLLLYLRVATIKKKATIQEQHLIKQIQYIQYSTCKHFKVHTSAHNLDLPCAICKISNITNSFSLSDKDIVLRFLTYKCNKTTKEVGSYVYKSLNKNLRVTDYIVFYALKSITSFGTTTLQS